MPECLNFYRIIVAVFAGHRFSSFGRWLAKVFGICDEIVLEASSRLLSLHRS